MTQISQVDWLVVIPIIAGVLTIALRLIQIVKNLSHTKSDS